MVKTREEVLAEMAEKEMANQQAQDTVKNFLSEEGVGDAILKVRNDVYNEYLKEKIATTPRIANDKETFSAIYGMALDQYEAKKKAPVAPVVAAVATAPVVAAAAASPATVGDSPVEEKDFEAYIKGKAITGSDLTALKNALSAAGIEV